MSKELQAGVYENVDKSSLYIPSLRKSFGVKGTKVRGTRTDRHYFTKEEANDAQVRSFVLDKKYLRCVPEEELKKEEAENAEKEAKKTNPAKGHTSPAAPDAPETGKGEDEETPEEGGEGGEGGEGSDEGGEGGEGSDQDPE